jgi:hypothetical protein
MEPIPPAQETVNQPVQQPVVPQSSRPPFLPILAVTLLLAVVGTGAYYLGKNSSNTSFKVEDAPVIAQPSPTVMPSKVVDEVSITQPSPTIDETANWKMYTNSSEFTFKYPSDWSIASIPTNFGYISLRSPDYVLNTEGIETLETGVELMVFTDTTTETSIDNKFEKDQFAGQIANSKTTTSVDGQRAIQYDYSYENTQATDTIFIKNGLSYLIKLKYPDSNTKNKYLSTYQGILESFKGL